MSNLPDDARKLIEFAHQQAAGVAHILAQVLETDRGRPHWDGGQLGPLDYSRCAVADAETLLQEAKRACGKAWKTLNRETRGKQAPETLGFSGTFADEEEGE